MRKTMTGVMSAMLLIVATVPMSAGGGERVVVTSSNTIDNQLLVYDTAGGLLQSLPTFGQGGVGGNAGGIATGNGTVAVVNFGSQTVSVFVTGASGLQFRDLIPVSSPPVSVAFGEEHLFVLGTTTVESHRMTPSAIEPTPDGIAGLIDADGSAAQVGVVGSELIVTEKSGVIERVQLNSGTVVGEPVAVPLPPALSEAPFGLVTRGSNAYVTIANSDLVAVIKNGRPTAVAATGEPGGAGQHAPCWIALVGPYLFTTNSPSHSVSRLIAAGANIVVDELVAAQTGGAPIDVAADGDLLALVESNGGGLSHVTQFHIDEDGQLEGTVSVAIPSAANGIGIIALP